jgi:hypothetical protein
MGRSSFWGTGSPAATPVPIDLAGTAAGVFKMSSMVGGALGVALLSAFGRSFSADDARRAAREAGLSEQDIAQARRALVGSDSFFHAIAKLPADLQARVTEAAETAFSSGAAHALVTTGAISIAATIIVAFIWPRSLESATRSIPTEGGAR